MSQKTVVIIGLQGFSLGLYEDKDHGLWKQRSGVRANLHWFEKEEKGITLRNVVGPDDLRGQPKLLELLKNNHGITPA